MVCCIFGHRDAPVRSCAQLERVLERLVAERQVDTVLIGKQGDFDRMAAGAIYRFWERYPQMKCCEVLAYFPRGRSDAEDFETILPEGIEYVMPRFAVSWRNRWMVDHSDVVIVYMTRNHGGTAAVVDYARRKGKEVINIAVN